MMSKESAYGGEFARPIGLAIAVGMLLCVAQAHAGHDEIGPGSKPTAGATKDRKVPPYRPVSVTPGARTYYQSVWGVDDFLVRRTDSGNLVRFSYRVVDPVRAAVLSDDRVTPHLIDPTRGVSLEIPSLEQVGDLRQKGKPLPGKVYWMVFSNKGDPVKAGDRVNVVIGSFHADGLSVE